MSLYLKKEIDENSILGIWKIEESFEDLLEKLFEFGVEANSHDILSLKNFSNKKRKIEWLCTRVLVNTLMNKNTIIEHNQYGKPYIPQSNQTISISHSHDYVAVVMTEKKEAGIDIEILSDKIARLALKFMNIKETEGIEQTNKILHMYLHWCAKETLYKIYSRKELNFVENLYIHPFSVAESGTCRGRISIKDFCNEYDLHYFTFSNYVIVYGIK